jgi:hypothetical protein
MCEVYLRAIESISHEQDSVHTVFKRDVVQIRNVNVVHETQLPYCGNNQRVIVGKGLIDLKRTQRD